MALADAIERAAGLIAGADGLLIAAGAGMGVDSGLPDFRGAEGFWQAYPALAQARIRFEEIASPVSFRLDAARAWGFYGHRLNLYRATVPHAGFGILRRWAETKPRRAFVVTSNVDGQFQRAGFAEVLEVHGSIHRLQCLEACEDAAWSADGVWLDVDEERCALRSAAPRCPHCGGLARPNVLMFGDPYWIDRETEAQRQSLEQWLAGAGRLVVVECGAGTAIPSIRAMSRRVAVGYDAPVIRINPRQPDLEVPGVELALGAREALERIDRAMKGGSPTGNASKQRAGVGGAP